MATNESANIEFDDYTTKEASEILEVTPQRVSGLCRGGILEGAFQRGGVWWIPKKAVEERLKNNPGRGRPKNSRENSKTKQF